MRETDTKVLEQAVEKAEKLNAKNYTDESYKAVQNALAAAKRVQADENATQDDIDAAAAALVKAIKALAPATNGSPETGDTAPVMQLTLLAVLSLCGIALVTTMRRRNAC